MSEIYQADLAYVHAAAFESVAKAAAAPIIQRLRSSPAYIRRILDFGCGAGPLTAALTDAGFETTGVDTSAELLKLARVRAPNAQFVLGSAYDVELRGYDAIVAVGEPLTYHGGDGDGDGFVYDLFRKAAEALPNGGMLIFDVIGLGQPSLAGRSWSSSDDWAVMVETTENQTERRLTRSIETFRRIGELYRRSCEIHTVRLFEVSRLRDLLASVGFSVETAQSYGSQQLPPRRHAFFATRVAAI